MDEFKKNLMKYAAKWVGRIAIPIAMRGEELAKDKTFVYLINEWAEMTARHERSSMDMLNRVMDTEMFESLNCDTDTAIEAYSDEYWGEKAGELSLTIRDILKDVYGID